MSLSPRQVAIKGLHVVFLLNLWGIGLSSSSRILAITKVGDFPEGKLHVWVVLSDAGRRSSFIEVL